MAVSVQLILVGQKSVQSDGPSRVNFARAYSDLGSEAVAVAICKPRGTIVIYPAESTRSMKRSAASSFSVMIAHRLSTVRNADRIIVLTEDSIAEQGTHDERIKKGGAYASMHNFTL